MRPICHNNLNYATNLNLNDLSTPKDIINKMLMLLYLYLNRLAETTH